MPLLAEAPLIVIDLVSAGLIGTTIGTGIVGAVKLFINFLDRHDARITKAITDGQEAHQTLSNELVSLHKSSLIANVRLSRSFDKLTDWLKNNAGTDTHRPLRDDNHNHHRPPEGDRDD